MILILAWAGAYAHAGELEKGFATPPKWARPWVNWIWLNGNITSNGITADLEAMRRVGIGGGLVMEVDYDTPKGPVSFFSPEWRNLFKHLCAEAKRLGLQIRMNNDAGYCGSGGPWITPELSMQKLVWTETVVSGPGQFDSVLPQPETIEHFYRDVAVLAVPTPDGDEVRMTNFSPKLTASTSASPSLLNALLDGDTNTTVALPQPGTNRPSVVQVEFPRPFAARQLVLRMPLSGDQIVHGYFQASDDGQVFKTVREFDAIPSTQVFNFPLTTASYFRVLFPTRNRDVDEFVISELELSPRVRIEGIEAKALFVRKLSYPGPSEFPGRAQYPELPPRAVIDPARIIDLTSLMQKDGRLKWDIPPGSWTILRLGHTSTGKKNHPSPEAGSGLECDKLSKAGAEAAFNGFMAKLVGDVRALVPDALVSTHIDSWEVGSQNWTSAMLQEFQRRREYNPLTLLPVFTGRVVGSFEISERFLWDFRQTVSELLVDNYAGHMRELAHRHGLGVSIEAYDAPCDDLTYAGRPDEPMAEFWTWPGFEMDFTCTEMSSVAHVYGKRIVGAEAFTAMDSEKWFGHPFVVKVFGDWAFCQGLNRFIIHRYALQPWTEPSRFPGMAYGPFGLHYERTETWWDYSRPWHEYLARCQYLLQRGSFVADICYLAAETAPRHWHNPDRSGNRGGYNFDACPAEVVLKRMSVRNGRLVLPDGMSYGVMALPDSETMTPELLARIKNLVAAGAIVVGRPPFKSPSLRGYPECDKRIAGLARELWGDCDGKTTTQHVLGKGKVIWGPTPEQVLARSGLPPDFIARGNSSEPVLGYTHRSLPGAEVYFVSNKTMQPQDAICAFRVKNLRPELWWPDTGHIEPVNVYDCNETVRLPIRLGSAGSVFVVFRKDSPVGPDRVTSVSCNGNPALETSWHRPEPVKKLPDVTNNFTFAVWVKPATGTTLPKKEAVFGDNGYFSSRNDALYPVLGHFVYHRPDQAGAGLSIGTNGVWVTECTADYWGAPLVLATPLTNWTHLTVVYRDGRPSLYLNGKFVREGLQSDFEVHCSVAVPQQRGSAPFNGELGEFYHVHRALSEKEVPELARSMPEPRSLEASPPVEFARSTNGFLQMEVSQPGKYVVETASGKHWRADVQELTEGLELRGPWEISFPPNWGAPEHAVLDHLISWSEHSDTGIKYFSGTGTYTITFDAPEQLLREDQRLFLDLGRVAIMARVRLNGKEMGTLWKPPFRLEITGALKSGANLLEVEVANLWINRMIGDEQLPEDSERYPKGSLKSWPEWVNEGKPSPTGRYTFTSYRLWTKDAPLQDSGLLGPVRIIPTRLVELR